MPLIAAALLSYAAGLLVGFGGAFRCAAALILAAAGLSLVRRDGRGLSLAALGAAGVLAAFGTVTSERRCRSSSLADSSFSMTLEHAVAPGAYVSGYGRPLVESCRVKLTIVVAHGHAPAGARVVVHGHAASSQRGLIVRGATIERVGSRSLLPSARAALGTSIDRAFGESAPVARALLIADTRSLDPALRDRFVAAGLVHVLSISGLHVALIALALDLLFSSLRLPRAPASVATVLVTALYIAVIGAPAPAIRAGMMIAVSALSRLAQRPTSPWAALALGAAAPLMEPRVVLDLGYQLSVVGMAGLIASGLLARRWIEPRLTGWRATLAVLMLASTVATIVTAPLVSWHFGRLSLVAPIANLVASPIVALAQPALFLALLCAPVPEVARFIGDASQPLLVLLDSVATFFAALPHASAVIAPSLTGAALAGAATAAILVACASHFPARPVIVALAALGTAIWLPFAPSRPGELELHVIDVGQGDAIALRTPGRRWILVDAGRSWASGDAGRASVIPYLRRRGGDVVAFILSHPHMDHAGGAASVLRALRPRTFWDGAYLGGSDAYRASLGTAGELAIDWRRAHPGESILVDGVRIEFLAPDSSWMQDLDDPNEASVVAVVIYGTVRFLLVGDAERGEEEWLLEHAGDALRADVLKVGHHGSATSSTPRFLSAVRPRVAVVSVGTANAYGHPNADVLHALRALGAEVLRTDHSGTVVVRTDGTSLHLQIEGDSWPLSRDSSSH